MKKIQYSDIFDSHESDEGEYHWDCCSLKKWEESEHCPHCFAIHSTVDRSNGYWKGVPFFKVPTQYNSDTCIGEFKSNVLSYNTRYENFSLDKLEEYVKENPSACKPFTSYTWTLQNRNNLINDLNVSLYESSIGIGGYDNTPRMSDSHKEIVKDLSPEQREKWMMDMITNLHNQNVQLRDAVSMMANKMNNAGQNLSF